MLKKHLIALNVLLLLVWRPFDHSWQSIWVERWGLSVLMLGLSWIWSLRYRHWIFPIAISYFLINCVAGSYLSGIHPGIPNDVILTLRMATQSQLILLFAFLYFCQSSIDVSVPIKIVSFVALLGITFSSHPWLEVPFLLNPSMAATFLVLATGVHPLSLIPIFLTHSWTALFCFLVGTAWRLRNYFATKVGLLSCALIVGIRMRDGIPDNGRFKLWANFYGLWRSSSFANLLFGFGPGSTRTWLPLLNLDSAKSSSVDLFLWAHNDWLQILIETGVIGILLTTAASIGLLFYASQKDRPVILAYFAAMVSNFPTHWALPALVGWVLVKSTILMKGDQYELAS